MGDEMSFEGSLEALVIEAQHQADQNICHVGMACGQRGVFDAEQQWFQNPGRAQQKLLFRRVSCIAARGEIM